MFLYYTNITADHSFRDRYFNREIDFFLLVSTFRDINRDIYSLSVQLIQNLPKPPQRQSFTLSSIFIHLPSSAIDFTLLPLYRSRLPLSHHTNGPRTVLDILIRRATAVVRLARLEQIHEFVEAELEAALLHAAFYGLLSEEALLVLEFEDALLDGIGDGEFVDCHVDCLGEAVDTVDGLFLDKLLLSLAYDSSFTRGDEKNLQDSKRAPG